jgi:hypothetical protein
MNAATMNSGYLQVEKCATPQYGQSNPSKVVLPTTYFINDNVEENGWRTTAWTDEKGAIWEMAKARGSFAPTRRLASARGDRTWLETPENLSKPRTRLDNSSLA